MAISNHEGRLAMPTLTQYGPYTIATAFLNGKVDSNSLAKEIASSSIITALERIDTDATTCSVWFKDALSAGDRTTLDDTNTTTPGASSVVGLHKGVSSKVEEPVLDDGRRLITSSALPKGMSPFYPGVGDDVANAVRWADTSNRWVVESDVAETKNVNFQFIDCVWISGGTVTCLGGRIGDHIDFKVVAPATVGSSNPGSGYFDKYALGGGANIYIPAAGDGDWDIDLEETLNANVSFLKAVPVPAPDGDGWFDFSASAHLLTVNAGQKGGYNLFDFEVTLLEYFPGFNLLGDTHYKISPSASAKMLPPQYLYKAAVVHGGTNHLEVAFNLEIGRL